MEEVIKFDLEEDISPSKLEDTKLVERFSQICISNEELEKLGDEVAMRGLFDFETNELTPPLKPIKQINEVRELVSDFIDIIYRGPEPEVHPHYGENEKVPSYLDSEKKESLKKYLNTQVTDDILKYEFNISIFSSEYTKVERHYKILLYYNDWVMKSKLPELIIYDFNFPYPRYDYGET